MWNGFAESRFEISRSSDSFRDTAVGDCLLYFSLAYIVFVNEIDRQLLGSQRFSLGFRVGITIASFNSFWKDVVIPCEVIYWE